MCSVLKASLASPWLHFEITLGSLWNQSGTTLRSPWGHIGSTLASLWGHFATTLGYTWDQTDDEVEVKFKCDASTKGKDVQVQFARTSLKVQVKGETLVDGKTGGSVAVDDRAPRVVPDQDHKWVVGGL